MIKKAIYPLSADPITNGHLAIIKRSLKLIQKLYIVILNNQTKNHLLSITERKEILEQVGLNLNQVKIITSTKLLNEVALKLKCNLIIRGIRSPFDVQTEKELKHIYFRQNPQLEFIYFITDEKYQFLSSSISKSLLIRGENCLDYFPLVVKKKLEEKLLKQHKIIVTGIISSGKSTLVNRLILLYQKKGIKAIEIDFDSIVKKIYLAINSKKYFSLKKKIIQYFFPEKKNIHLNQEKIRKLVFRDNHKNNLLFLQNTLKPYLYQEYQKSLKGKQGIFFLNAPLAAEYDMLNEANNQILFIKVKKEKQLAYLKKREASPREILLKKISAAGTNLAKLRRIKNRIKKDKFGKVIIYSNNSTIDEKKIKNLKKKIDHLFHI